MERRAGEPHCLQEREIQGRMRRGQAVIDQPTPIQGHGTKRRRFVKAERQVAQSVKADGEGDQKDAGKPSPLPRLCLFSPARTQCLPHSETIGSVVPRAMKTTVTLAGDNLVGIVRGSRRGKRASIESGAELAPDELIRCESNMSGNPRYLESEPPRRPRSWGRFSAPGWEQQVDWRYGKR